MERQYNKSVCPGRKCIINKTLTGVWGDPNIKDLAASDGILRQHILYSGPVYLNIPFLSPLSLQNNALYNIICKGMWYFKIFEPYYCSLRIFLLHRPASYLCNNALWVLPNFYYMPIHTDIKIENARSWHGKGDMDTLNNMLTWSLLEELAF